MNLEYIVTNETTLPTIKSILISYFGISHRLLTNLKKESKILINALPCLNVNNKVKQGDIICVCLNKEETNENIIPTSMNLDIIYEDEWILVLNKEAGIPVHPSTLNLANTLANRCSLLL